MALQAGIFDWIEASGRSPAEIYEHKLELAAAADRAGFHGFFIAEHHGTPLSIDGSPATVLSALFQRTRRLRAGALTFCLPWYHPYRFYSEVCMLDQLSHGRLELGVGRGVSPIESKIFGLNSIDESRERYRETLETFFAACASPTMKINGPEVNTGRAAREALPAALPAALVPELEQGIDRVHRAPRLPHRVHRQAQRLQAALRALSRAVGAAPQ